MHAGVLSCRLCLVSGTVQVTGYRPEWARVEHGLLLRLDIAHRCWKHAWFWLWPSCARKAAMATPYSNESFVPTTSWRTRRKFHSRKISSVEGVRVSMLQKDLHQGARPIRDADQICQHCFKRYKDLFSAFSDSWYRWHLHPWGRDDQ